MARLSIAQIGNPSPRIRASPVSTREIGSVGSKANRRSRRDHAGRRRRRSRGAASEHAASTVYRRGERQSAVSVQAADPLAHCHKPTIEPRTSEVFRSCEGCLSVPDLRGIVVRHADIELSYLDRHECREGSGYRGCRLGHSSTSSTIPREFCFSIALTTPEHSPPGRSSASAPTPLARAGGADAEERRTSNLSSASGLEAPELRADPEQAARPLRRRGWS